MKLCDVEFCDFVIWRSDELVVKRIERDDTFLLEAIAKATNFYKYGILPELVGKWYTAASSLSGQALSHGSALLPSPQASTSGSSSKGGTSYHMNNEDFDSDQSSSLCTCLQTTPKLQSSFLLQTASKCRTRYIPVFPLSELLLN